MFAVALAQPKPEPAKSLDISEHVLDNGLKVIVVHRPGVPVVSSYVWYKVGSMDEQPGVTGVAHFLEHMMFKGSKDYKVGDVDKVTVRNGGSNNAFTSNDYTAYYIDLPKSRWREAMKIEADRMAHLTLDLTEFDSEKKVVQSESDISSDNPSSRMWDEIGVTIYGKRHPYGHPVLGWPHDVQDTTRRDMRLFYEQHYHPNHATLVLAGDITSGEALPVLKDLFGRIPRGPELNRPKVTEIKFQGPVDFEIKSESEVIEFGRCYLTVPATHPDRAALDMLGVVLGGGVTSRLYRSMVDDTQVCTSIGCGQDSNILSGLMYMYGELNQGHTRQELIAGVEAAIAALIKDGVTADELERARNGFIAGAIYQRESASALASALGQAETVEGDWRAAIKYPDLIKAVTAADIVRVAKAYMRPQNTATGWIVPELTVPPAETSGDAKAEPLPVKRSVLPNGLIVLLLPRQGLPVVSVQASVRAWRTAETEKDFGIANFTGSLLDAGTKAYSKQQLAEAIEKLGSSISFDGSGSSMRCMTEHTEASLKLMAEGLLRPTFPQEELELTRTQMLAWMESNKNETAWFSRAAANAAVYGPQNPLGRPAEGSPETIKSFTREQLMAWHSRWFRPDNTVIAAVGDFDADTMLKKLEAEFGAWKNPAEPLKLPEIKFSAPDTRSGTQAFFFKDSRGDEKGEQQLAGFRPDRVNGQAKRITVDLPAKDQVMLRLTSLGITRNDPDYVPLLVMESILGTSPGFTDRFSHKLRDQMGLAYSTYANITGGSGVTPGAFLGYIGTRPGNVEKALKVMYEMIDEVRTQPVSDEELRNAKDYLKGSFVFGQETTGQLAGLLISMERYNLGWDYMVKYTSAVEAVTKEDILRVSQKHLVPERMVEVLAGPIGKITPADDSENPGDGDSSEGGSEGSEGGSEGSEGGK